MAFKYPALNRVFDGIGRIQKTFGTDDPKTIEGMRVMVEQLYRGGRNGHVDHAPLIKLRDGKDTLLKMYDRWTRQGEVKNLTDVSGLDFKTEAYRWLEAYPSLSDSERNNYGDKFKQLLKWKSGITTNETAGGKRSTVKLSSLKSFKVGEVAKVLTAYRVVCVAADTAEKFKKTKSAIQSFVKSEYGEEHPVYKEVQKVETFSTGEKTRGEPWTVPDVQAVLQKLKPEIAAQFWTMCLTGITLKPYSNGLKVLTDDTGVKYGIDITDTKQDHKDGRRNRVVPYIEEPAPMALSKKTLNQLVNDPTRKPTNAKAFARALKAASNGRFKPTDARKCYETWLAESGIHGERRDQYMGHVPQSMKDKYGRVKDPEFLKTDAAKVREYLARKKAVVINPNTAKFFKFAKVKPDKL